MTTKKTVAVSGSSSAVAVKPGPVGSPIAPVSGSGSAASGTSPLVPAGKPVSGFRLKLQQMLAGVQAMLPDGATVTSTGNAPLSKSEMVTQLQGALGNYAAVDSEEQSLAQARLTLAAQQQSVHAFYTQFKDALVMFYGKGNPALAQYGIQSKAGVRKLSPVELVAKAERSAQTRAIRHTQGKVVKQAQKFVGTVGVATQVNAPTAPAPAEAQAPQAPAATPGPGPATS